MSDGPVLAARLRALVAGYWFWLLMPLWLASAWSVSQAPGALADPMTLERVLLFDFLVFLPLLYAVFLRGALRPAGVALRCAALAMTGLWFIGWLMPEGEGQILPWLGWLRALVLPIGIGLELLAFAAILKVAYSAEPDEDRLLASGMPAWLVRALLAEARFWKRVWRWLSGGR